MSGRTVRRPVTMSTGHRRAQKAHGEVSGHGEIEQCLWSTARLENSKDHVSEKPPPY